MPSFSYTVPAEDAERSPLGAIKLSENSANIPRQAGSKLAQIARRSGTENLAEREPGQLEAEQAVEAAVALLEKCTLAQRARGKSVDDEADAAEESALTLVKACAQAAAKHAGKAPSKKEATKLMLQARIQELEAEIRDSKTKLGAKDLAQECEALYREAVHGYERKVEPFLRKAQNPFEPADQHALQVQLAALEQRIVDAKKVLRKKLEAKVDQSKVQELKAKLRSQETAMTQTVGDLTKALQQHADQRKALERELDEAVAEHQRQAAELQQRLQLTIERNLKSREDLAAELRVPIEACEEQHRAVQQEVDQLETILMQ